MGGLEGGRMKLSKLSDSMTIPLSSLVTRSFPLFSFYSLTAKIEKEGIRDLVMWQIWKLTVHCSNTCNKMRNLDVMRRKLGKMKKVGSHQESNPRHLWLEPPVLCHGATVTGQPPPPIILYTYWCTDRCVTEAFSFTTSTFLYFRFITSTFLYFRFITSTFLYFRFITSTFLYFRFITSTFFYFRFITSSFFPIHQSCKTNSGTESLGSRLWE